MKASSNITKSFNEQKVELVYEDALKDWYDFIEDLVRKFQEGDGDAGGRLIQAFKPYMSKYIKILCSGLLDLNDLDSRKFISLFIADAAVRRDLARALQPTHVRSEAYKSATLLARLCQPMDKEDIEQELALVLLILAKRYKKKGKKNFCGYVYNSYRYELQRRLADMTKDPIVYRADTNISYHDEENLAVSSGNELPKDIDSTDTTIRKAFEDELDNSWVRGITCSEVFYKLTQFQRLIIKMHYYDGLSDPKIADKLGMHINTIFRQRRNAINKLRNADSYEED